MWQKIVAAAKRPYWDRPDPRWRVRRWPDLFAFCIANVFFWLSLTPSLVPRPWLLQGVIGGITAAIGYGLGAVLAWFFRRVLAWRDWQPSEQARARGWQVALVLTPIMAVWLISESAHMQRQLRELQSLPPSMPWHTPMIALIALAVLALLVVIARSIRLATGKLIHWLDRALPRPLAVGTGLVVSAILVTFGVRDVVFDRGVIDIADSIAAKTDASTKEGITQSGSRYVSGSPDSLIPWDDLGFQGRNFTGAVPSKGQIEKVTGEPAVDPVRVYVSSAHPEAFSDESPQEPFRAQARLAVRELERTGAFDRQVLAIAGTTGTGWVNSTVAEPLEYMYGGDTAFVAIQYSYLPSWVSFLVDKEKAGQATRALVKAVQKRVDTMPAEERPKLVVTGESLGAYAIEATFGSAEQLVAQMDGALLLGPPNFGPVSTEIRSDRDQGSPVWRPEFDEGRHIRFAQFPEKDFKRLKGPWRHPRVVYLQNASDPVVWWSWDLALQRPEWVDPPLGPDITPEVNWFPFVTFWQTSVDMAVSYGVPAPHGHRYGDGPVDGWAEVVPPKGWSAEDTERLKKFFDDREAPY
ncbi:alpha/beta hydrolase [Streptomyces boninensis]|uniref:alpha/beta hydrolase n=1 Tax=Streptomyces boninensis TaxID=2039455 RepID=UPI003B20CBD7